MQMKHTGHGLISIDNNERCDLALFKNCQGGGG
jgi:hypothetical protein